MTHTTKAIYVIILIALVHLRLSAQVRMESLGVSEGLSQGFVTCQIQDSRGFLWLGTYDGLNRYDGYNIRRFTTKPFDPWSLQASFITQLYEDSQQLIWVGTHQGLQVFDPLTERFYKLSLAENKLPANHVGRIIGDSQGNIFLHIPSELSPSGLFRLRIPTDFAYQLRHLKNAVQGIVAEPVSGPATLRQPCTVVECVGDTMPLIYDDQQVVYRYAYGENCLIPFDLHQLSRSSTDDHNILWGKYSGFFFRRTLPDGRDSIPPPNCWKQLNRMPDGSVGFWFLGNGPFFRKNNRAPITFDVFQKQEVLLENVAFNQAFTRLLDRNSIWNNNLLVDQTGILWSATGGWGVRKINPRQLSFGTLLSGHSISSLRELSNDLIWVRLYSEESFVLNTKTWQRAPAPWKSTKSHYEVMMDSRGNYWLMEPYIKDFNNKRLLKYDQKTGQSRSFAEEIPFIGGVPEKILEDRDGNIWIAAHQGLLFRCRPGQMTLEQFEYENLTANNSLNLRATSIIQDKQGIIWIGTNRGLLRVNRSNAASPNFSFLKHAQENPNSISIDWVTSICLDPKDENALWLGTRGGGLNHLNTKDQTFTYVTESPDGLSDNVVYGILPDDTGNLWCSTNRGLCRFNPSRNTFVNYQESDGLLSTEFNTNAYLRTKDGRFWFGGVNGLHVFKPETIHAGNSPPLVAITGIKVLGATRLPDTETSLSLPYAENNVLFEFAALHFANPATNRFRHRLKGIDKEWVNDGTTHTANYAALPPGTYWFELQGATADSPWSAQTLSFCLIIRSPWYKSWFAILVYLMAITAGIWGIIRYREKMFRLEHAAETNQRESQRLKEFEAVKNQFFTHAAHELRTPLTVILGLANRLKHGAPAVEIETNAHNIVEQGNTLLQLTNQILDLAKLEGRQFALNLSNGNICQFIAQHIDSLTPLAESKALQLLVRSELPAIWMDFDPAQVQKVINNLVVNAIRHSAPGSVVQISIALADAGKYLKLTVEDQGEGIAPEDLPHIFDRFYQSSKPSDHNGASGLGLTLTRDLVQVMGGEIKVESQPGKGATFIILLPIENKVPRLNPVAISEPVLKKVLHPLKAPENTKLPLLLVLEDNAAVADFLKLSLQDHFRLVMAVDGAQGIEMALDLIPDLILTDVAMPKKDGYEVTSTLKNDLRTSHIPIVMLTAKVEQRDRQEGQRRGANAYLTKPFEAQELLQVLNNLLHLQAQWKRRYAQLSATQQALNGLEMVLEEFHSEDEFMQKLYAIFEHNFNDEGFNLERLCRLLGMSSSQLDRKLKALSDKSPMQLLRSFKLQKAREMLQTEPKMSIKDVCFRTGFKSPSHFSRAFSEEFGVRPSGV